MKLKVDQKVMWRSDLVLGRVTMVYGQTVLIRWDFPCLEMTYHYEDLKDDTNIIPLPINVTDKQIETLRSILGPDPRLTSFL